MIDRANIAIENKKKGYNCAQAIVCAYKDVIKMDETSLFKISEGFGSGIAATERTCGVLIAMIMIAGALNSTATFNNPNSKTSTYNLGQDLIQQFQILHKSIDCKDLKKENPLSCNSLLIEGCSILNTTLNLK